MDELVDDVDGLLVVAESVVVLVVVGGGVLLVVVEVVPTAVEVEDVDVVDVVVVEVLPDVVDVVVGVSAVVVVGSGARLVDVVLTGGKRHSPPAAQTSRQLVKASHELSLQPSAAIARQVVLPRRFVFVHSSDPDRPHTEFRAPASISFRHFRETRSASAADADFRAPFAHFA